MFQFIFFYHREAFINKETAYFSSIWSEKK